MKHLFFFLSAFFPLSLLAQDNTCSCNQVMEKLITKIETEYPGFAHKTIDYSSYKTLKNNLLNQSHAANNEACRRILKQYTDFFKDPHLWVGTNGTPFSTNSNTEIQSLEIDLPDFKNKITQTKDEYEGIWANENYVFGVKKTGSIEHTGFIIDSKYPQWKSKNIKFKLFPNGTFEYALLDGTIKRGDYRLLDKSILYLEDVSVTLVKQTSKPVLNKLQIEEKIRALNGFYFKSVTPKTALLKLPSMEQKYLATIDSLIENNKSLLENSENLIIDLRGNPGGTTDSYQKLLPYISGKIIRNTGAEFLATQTYIDQLEKYKKTLDQNTDTKGLDAKIKVLKEHLGNFVNFNKDGDLPYYDEKVEVASKSPKHIIILANKMTGSSAEYFLFIAKQSKKVKIFGKPSYGALDYGNAFLTDLDCGYQVFLPTYRALRLPDYPIDNIGIQPDIYLENTVKDWVTFAVDYLEN
ncbi:S41 family peptidase [Pedobacter sp.]|uniref:S41 family peptidase n=1 Tax=Pedobacter sp. TaxID=1411316 RepID=UPI0031E34B44